MASSSPPALTLEASLSTVWRVDSQVAAPPSKEPLKKGPAAEAAEAQATEALEQRATRLTPGNLSVEIDAVAGRFVHTLTDANTQEVKWRYPSDTQLAYSRAVATYMRAISGG